MEGNPCKRNDWALTWLLFCWSWHFSALSDPNRTWNWSTAVTNYRCLLCSYLAPLVLGSFFCLLEISSFCPISCSIGPSTENTLVFIVRSQASCSLVISWLYPKLTDLFLLPTSTSLSLNWIWIFLTFTFESHRIHF